MADHSELDHAVADGTFLMICGPTAAGKSGLALALAILGNEQTIVYDGSWTEWGASDAPIETGSLD